MSTEHKRRELRDSSPPDAMQQKALAALAKDHRYQEGVNMGQNVFDVSGLVPFTPATPEELKEAGIVFSLFPPNVHTCEQVALRLAQGPAPAGIELGEIISHFKDDAIEHTDACNALSAKHLEEMLAGEIALLERNLSRIDED